MSILSYLDIDFLIYALIVLSIALFFGTVIMAFDWGLKSGQFENFTRSSEAIFDSDEPIGLMTDHFPNEELPAGKSTFSETETLVSAGSEGSSLPVR